MPIVSAHKCDIGRQSKQNDDYVWVDEEMGLYIVADGMGGHEAGDIASKLTATTVGSSIVEKVKITSNIPSSTTIKKTMIEAIEAANKAVFRAARQAGQKRKMGTTIVVALVQHAKAFISHAGDSRAYLARGALLEQLTEDDSWGAQFAKSGVTDKSGAGKGTFDHFLTKSVGQDTVLDPSFLEVGVEPGDWLLLCSDGLWNMIGNEQILAELQNANDDPVAAVEALVTAANDAGGKDNISVVAIKILA
jgi:protein phosphatase